MVQKVNYCHTKDDLSQFRIYHAEYQQFTKAIQYE